MIFFRDHQFHGLNAWGYSPFYRMPLFCCLSVKPYCAERCLNVHLCLLYISQLWLNNNFVKPGLYRSDTGNPPYCRIKGGNRTMAPLMHCSRYMSPILCQSIIHLNRIHFPPDISQLIQDNLHMSEFVAIQLYFKYYSIMTKQCFRYCI